MTDCSLNSLPSDILRSIFRFFDATELTELRLVPEFFVFGYQIVAGVKPEKRVVQVMLMSLWQRIFIQS